MDSPSPLRENIDAALQRDPAARIALEVFLTSPGVHALAWHRVAHWLWRWEWFLLGRMVSSLARFITGVEIHPGAVMGRRVVIDHGMGVVIGETAIVGDDCLIYHGATLGGNEQVSRDEVSGRRHPILGNGVLVGTGATILGPVTIGEGAKIAAMSVVLTDIPAGAVALGIPAKVKRSTKAK